MPQRPFQSTLNRHGGNTKLFASLSQAQAFNNDQLKNDSFIPSQLLQGKFHGVVFLLRFNINPAI